MDWLGIGSNIFTLGSTGFDIGSDVANSLNFLGVFNNDRFNNITYLSSTNMTYLTSTNRILPYITAIEMTHCAPTDQGEDFLWGIISLGIVLLPGAFSALAFTLSEIFKRNWGLAFLFFIFGVPLNSVMFPLSLLVSPLM